MTDVERLAVLIEANTKGYERAMARIEQKTDKAVRAATGSMKGLDAQMKAIAATGRTLMTAFGAGFAAGGLAQLPGLFRGIVEEAAGLKDLADKIGTTTDALQELRFAAEQSGSSASDLDQAMVQFSRRLGEAAAGGGTLAKILAANGVALRNADGSMRPVTDLLRDYADLIKNAASESDALVLAQEAFRDTDMANVLRDGSAALDEQMQHARDLGAVMREDLIESAAALDDEFARLQNRISTGFKSAVLEGADALGALDSFLMRMGRNIAELGGFEQFRAKNILRGKLESGVTELLPSWYDDWRPEAAAGGGRGTGGGTRIPRLGGSSRDGAAEEAERQRKAVVDLIDSLTVENQLIGMSEVDREVETQLRRAGAIATEQQREQIELLVRSQHAAEEAQRQLNETTSYFGDMAYDGLSSIIVHGEKATEVLQRMVSALADAALQAVLLGQGPMAGIFGTSGKGVFGAIGGALGRGGGLPMGGLFHTGGIAASGGAMRSMGAMRSDEFPAILQKGEMVIPRGGFSSAGGGPVTIRVDVAGARGNAEIREMVMAGVAAGLGRYDKGLPGKVGAVISSGQADAAMSNRYGAKPPKIGRGL